MDCLRQCQFSTCSGGTEILFSKLHQEHCILVSFGIKDTVCCKIYTFYSLIPRLHCPAFFALWAVEPGNEAILIDHAYYFTEWHILNLARNFHWQITGMVSHAILVTVTMNE